MNNGSGNIGSSMIFANALDVVAKRNGVIYSGSLLGLTITPAVVYDSSSTDVWDFEVSLPSAEVLFRRILRI